MPRPLLAGRPFDVGSDDVSCGIPGRGREAALGCERIEDACGGGGGG